MRFLWISGALAILVAGALLFWVERRLRARTRRVLAAPVVADSRGERVFDEMPMRHLGTAFADRLPLPTILEERSEVNVFCTAEALFAGRLVIPLSSVDDAALVRGSLRVRWRRGGELLETVLQARAHDLERLRREIHLRQKNVAEKLMALVQPR